MAFLYVELGAVHQVTGHMYVPANWEKGLAKSSVVGQSMKWVFANLLKTASYLILIVS